MKKSVLSLLGFFLIFTLFAGSVTKTFYFSNYSIKEIGNYKTVSFENTKLSGFPGEPVLPYQAISLLLPPGQEAVSISISGEEETPIPGSFLLYPQQPPRAYSAGPSYEFVKNEKVYAINARYPSKTTGQLMTQYLNGYAFALSSFTPALYNPATGALSYYKKVTVTIVTKDDPQSDKVMKNLSSSKNVWNRVKSLA